jgi:hypothetical protein
MRGGHIAAVEILTDTSSDEAAVKQSQAIYTKRKHAFDGFEVWDRARFLYRHPIPVQHDTEREAATTVPDKGRARIFR